MKKIFITFLIAVLLISPVFVSAQETQPTADTEVVMPIYFFADEDGNIFGITPISEELFIWFYPLSEEELQVAQGAGADVVPVNFTGNEYDGKAVF